MTPLQERLVVEHVPMAERFADKFLQGMPPHVDRDAYRGAALEGLAKAAVKWDPARGVPFETFASPRIWFAMEDEARSLSPLAREDFKAIRAGKRSRTVKRPGRGRGTVEVQIMREVSLHQPCSNDGELMLEETIGDGRDHYAEVDDRSELERILDVADEVLTDREWRALFHAHGEGGQAARDLGISDSRVSQLRSSAIRKLRRAVAA